MRGILAVAVCLLFLLSVAIAEENTGSSINIGMDSGGGGSSPTSSPEISDPPSDSNQDTVTTVSSDDAVTDDILAGDSTNGVEIVEICDSLSGSCTLMEDSTDRTNLEADQQIDSVMADQQMDLQAEGIDASALQIASHADDLNKLDLGVVSINWLSKDTATENLTGVLSIEKFLQIWGNSTSGVASVSLQPGV